MNTENVFNNSGIIVSNPNYNPKTKKGRAQQPFFHTLDVSQDITSGAANEFAKNADNAWVMGDTHSYQRYGVTPNIITNLDKERAENQSNFAKTFNSLGQALVSETILGTIKAVPDLFDAVANGIFQSDGDYQNPISNKLQEWQDYFRNEVAPIYSDPERNDIYNGGLTNWGWWTSNVPSVMSSLTLLLPSTGIVKGIGYLGKLAKTSKLASMTRNGIKGIAGIDRAIASNRELNALQKGINKIIGSDGIVVGSDVESAASRFASIGGNALLQRTMENYQEAQGVYKDMYNEAYDNLNRMNAQQYQAFVNKNPELLQDTDTNDKEAVARRIAKKSADTDFLMNYSNIVFDVIQMYGLRNMWKGIRNSDAGSAAVSRAARLEKLKVGKTAEEFEKYYANIGKMKKAGWWIKDHAKAEKLVIAGELSEGIEESVNYISQMDGMNVGKLLLSEQDADHSPFDNRLQKYLKSGGLADSAFWGVLGGVVFHHLGSGFGRVRQTFEDRANKKEDKTTGEQGKSSPFSISELGETKSRKADIAHWGKDTNLYIERMNKINDGKNPFDNDKSFTSHEESQAAKEAAENDFITTLALRAGHHGNLDYLKSFLQSEEVRKAMVEKGVVNEAESKQIQANNVAKVDAVLDAYTKELSGLIGIVQNRNHNKKEPDRVPIEYLQEIASANVVYNQKIANTKNKEQVADNLINTVLNEENIRKVIGQNYTGEQVKGAVRHALITNMISDLYARKKELIAKNRKTISDKVAIDNINRTINEYSDMLSNDELRLTTAVMLASERDEQGNLGRNSQDPLAKAYDDLFSGVDKKGIQLTDETIVRNFERFAKENGLSKRLAEFDSSANVLNQIQTANNNITRINNLVKEADKEKNSTGVKLSDLILKQAELELSRRYDQAQVVNNESDLAAELSYKQNTMNEARKKVIDTSYKYIDDLADKYKDEENGNIRAAVNAYFNDEQDNFDDATSFMTNKEREAFKESLDALHLSSGLNYRLANTIQGSLILRTKIKAARNKANDGEEEPESATSSTTTNDNTPAPTPSPALAASPTPAPTPAPKGEPEQSGTQNNALQSPQPASTNNQSAPQPESSQAQGNTQQSNSKKEKAKPKFDASKSQNLSFNDDGDVTGITSEDNGRFTLVPGENNQYEVMSNDGRHAWHDDKLFENAELANEDDIELVHNPYITVDDDGNVIGFEKGLLGTEADVAAYEKALDEQAKQEEESKEEEEDKPAATSSTGRLEETTPPPAASAEESNEKEEPTTPATETKKTIANLDMDESTALNMELSRNIMGALMDDNVDVDEVIKQQKDALISQGFDSDEVNKYVDDYANEAKAMFGSSVADLYLQTVSVETQKLDNLTKDFTKAADEFLNRYAKNTKIVQRNGKYYGRLEDILRYIEQESKYTGAPEIFYNTLKDYLTSEAAKDKFVLTDVEEIDKADFLRNVHKSSYVRSVELGAQSLITTVKLDLSEVTDEDGIKAAQKELKLVNSNDALETEISKKNKTNTTILLYKHNGVTIGWQALASIDKATGLYVRPADDWMHTIAGDNNTPDGPVKEFIKDILSRDTIDGIDYSTLDDIIYRAAFDKLSKDEYKQLVAAFASHKGIQRAVSNHYVRDAENPNYEKLLNGLAKLWRYCYQVKPTNNVAVGEYNDILIDSIDTYYDKLREEINIATNVANGVYTPRVNVLSKGEVIRAHNKELTPDGKTRPSKDVARPIKEVLSNSSEAYIGATSNGYVAVSGLGTQKYTGYNSASGQTFLALPNTNGTIDYVAAFPRVYIGDTYYRNGEKVNALENRILNSLVDSVTAQLEDRLANVKSLDDWNEVKEFINDIFNFRRNAILSLGNSIVVQNNGNLVLKANGHEYTFFARSAKDPNAAPNVIKRKDGKLYKFDDVSDLIEDIKASAKINISSSLLNGDNNTNLPTKNKFISRDKTGFHINIPAYNGKNAFDINNSTYSQFLIDNDLVRVDLEQENSSNYRAVGIDKIGSNQTLQIDIFNTSESRPVEDVVDETPTDTPQTIVRNAINSIINNDSIANKGETIAEYLLSEKSKDSLSKIVKLKKYNRVTDAIFPENFIFDDDKIQKFRENDEANKNALAYYDSENEEIVVGNDWLSRTVDANTAGDDAVRVLIHEKLHSQINNSRNPKQFREKLRTIYDDFVKAIDADLANLNDSTFDEINARFDNKAANIDALRGYLTHIKEYQFEKFSTRPDTQLEEFIVESLTSKGLMDYLNSVKVEGEHKGKANTLWQKIMEFISRLFGIEIRDESLRAKEFNILANKFKENKVAPKTEIKEETKAPVEGTLEFKEDEVKPEEKVPEEVLADDNITNITEGNDAVGEDELDDLLNMGSSVDDKTLSSFSSLYSAVRALPMDEQSRMFDMVERGEFSISCR
jgi:calcineurin-like phosphoesterase family protein